MKYAVTTLGCKVNIFETESVCQDFDNAGYQRVEFDEISDVYVINTCTVTNKSDSKSRKMIRRAINNNPDAIVVVMGCYAQISANEIATITGVDIIVGNSDKDKVVSLVQDYVKSNSARIYVDDILKNRSYNNLTTSSYKDFTRAFVKIQDGCNNFCTFCIIPYARGLMRSRDKEDIFTEIKTLIDNGYLEIVLTGIHTGGYGTDLDNYSFVDLVKDILKIDGLKRLRISSIEFNQVTDELIDLISSDDRMAKHLHIPIQSGSDDVLTAMHRHYDVSTFISKIKHIQSMVSNIAITTDLIVGFPLETEDCFNETITTLNNIGFYDLHVFPYSIRNGTKAALLPQLSDSIKKDRMNIVLGLNKQFNERFESSLLNLHETLIIEKIEGKYAYGRLSNYVYVRILNEDYQLSQYLDIIVENVDNGVVTVKKRL